MPLALLPRFALDLLPATLAVYCREYCRMLDNALRVR
jgi:hypothetical protein